jgi:16S rRNA (uracil1498-N3)-methyltransferase
MHRFFVRPSSIQGEQINLTGAVVHQIRNVLRLTPGDLITVLDDSGWEYEVQLTDINRQDAKGSVLRKSLARSEPRAKVTLYQSLLKGDKFDWVLQKGTELGVVEFVPMVTNRCVIGSIDDVRDSRSRRWRRIILEASEQCGRGRLPRLHDPLLFTQACERARHAEMALMPWEGESERPIGVMLAEPSTPKVTVQGQTTVLRRPFSISVFIGPEGGFTTREVDQARKYGIVPVSLGPRILRAETAALVSATIILHELEDL